MKNKPLKIINVNVQPGEKITLALPLPELYTCAPMYLPIHVIHGKRSGPTLLICGAMHGDEVNGVAITQKLLNLRLLQSIRGALLVIPQMNIYGMISLTRTLPDRRDLDGSFPGSEQGSFASRLASLLDREILGSITHCIDLHTGEPHIKKLPQIKTLFDFPEAKALAKQFAAPVMVEAVENQGLLYLLRKERSVPTILYEAGEALRLDENCIRIGVQGIVRVMRHLEMLPPSKKEARHLSSREISDSQWLRASSSGLCELFRKTGQVVKQGARIARITDPFGTEQKEELFAPNDGIIVAHNHLPILNEGEPICQIAQIRGPEVAKIENWDLPQNGGEIPVE